MFVVGCLIIIIDVNFSGFLVFRLFFMARLVGRDLFIVFLGILGLLGFPFCMIGVFALKLWADVIF